MQQTKKLELWRNVNMTNNNGVYIPSIDAKDIYLSAHYIEENPEGYNLKLKDV